MRFVTLAAWIPVVFFFGSNSALRAAEVPAPAHDKAYWRSIVAQNYAVPEGGSPFELIVELTGSLGSADPELRDEFGYGIPSAWIYRDKLLAVADLGTLRRLWQSKLSLGIGAAQDEAVLLRSFSALDLSVLAALDNEWPFLEAAAFEELLQSAIDYLSREKDVRGFVPGTGWHHSSAHTADLLKFLGRNRRLKPADQDRILAAIGAKLTSAGAVYVWGEDDRFARAVLSLLRRADFSAESFNRWVDARASEWSAVWTTEPFDPMKFVAAQNGKNLLKSLLVLLSSVDSFPARDASRERVLAAVARMG